MTIKIELIPLLKDNYAYLLIEENGKVAIVDPSEAAPVITVLEEKGLKLDYILNTHHHADHTGGNKDLKDTYDCQIVGPEADRHRIAGLDIGLKEGDVFALGAAKAEILETPGHTSGHICFYFAEDKALFCGDTLFAMGCGRLFEGTPEQMWNSLTKIMALPDSTRLYCGHEYTLSNGIFSLEIEPDNQDLQKRVEEVKGLRKAGIPTIPSTLALEKKTNIFMRAGSAAHFAEIRRQKDAA